MSLDIIFILEKKKEKEINNKIVEKFDFWIYISFTWGWQYVTLLELFIRTENFIKLLLRVMTYFSKWNQTYSLKPNTIWGESYIVIWVF